MRALYVSQTGMAENLGQSQVLPYVRGLARRGVEFDLVSHELVTVTGLEREALAASLMKDGIHWHPVTRVARGTLATRVEESARGVVRALGAVLRRRHDIVHGRSYIATAIGDAVARFARRAKLLFDCRGMLGEEYLDAGHWTKDRLEYRLLKRYERRLFQRSDGIVVLTRALQRWLEETGALGRRPVTEVVPCCVDLERFQPSAAARAEVRAELGIGDAFAILYAGSLGSWYLEPEMTRIAAAIRAVVPGRAVFVCFSPSDASRLEASLAATGFPRADVVVRRIAPPDMPRYLACGDVGLSFIQSCFSKKGSSPTKVAEYLACGNVAIVNGDIGDQADLTAETEACVVVRDFGEAEIARAARTSVALATCPRAAVVAAARAAARRHFGLEEVGIARYARLYERLVTGTPSAA